MPLCDHHTNNLPSHPRLNALRQILELAARVQSTYPATHAAPDSSPVVIPCLHLAHSSISHHHQDQYCPDAGDDQTDGKDSEGVSVRQPVLSICFRDFFCLVPCTVLGEKSVDERGVARGDTGRQICAIGRDAGEGDVG